MGWERRGPLGKKYFYLCEREGDRVRHRYVGCGPKAVEAAAAVEQRKMRVKQARLEQARHDDAVAPLVALAEWTDLLVRAHRASPTDRPDRHTEVLTP